MPHAFVASGAALASVTFQSVDFDAPGRPDQHRSIVVLDDTIDHWPERRFIRRVRTDPARYATVVLMPASEDPDRVLWDCQEEVAPDEAFP